MSNGKVLVLCATGKMGKNVCRALVDNGFEVYGTTRNKLGGVGKNVIPVICDYTKREDLDIALKTTGCKKVFIITDFFLAAKKSVKREIEQGKIMVDACKAAGCEHVIYSSVGDADKIQSDKVKHLLAKPVVENYLLESGIKYVTIARPFAFFENLDDPANWNPLKPGKVKFLTEASTKFISTYDVGCAVAVFLKEPETWNNKKVEMTSWEGTLADVAKARENVTGMPTKPELAMPLFFRWLFLNDLHHMCLYFEKGYPGTNADIEAFKKIVPKAFDAVGWFRFHEKETV